jgi:divalent metal cation (Fe/Co/Zn/Cd) transporter
MTCGCLFGVIGIVFCYMAMQAADAGNLADAEHKLKWGKITTVVGFAVGLALGIIGLLQLRELWGTVIASLGGPS